MKIKFTSLATLIVAICCSMQVHGQGSNALNFDGVDDQVNCGNGALDITGTSITLEAWIKLDALSGLIWQSTIAAKTSPAGGGYIFKAGGADGQVEFTFGYPGVFENFTSAAGVVTAGTWHHVAATYDGSFVRLYVDGAEVLSQFETDAIGSAEPNSLYLGNDNTFAPRNFDGAIDEVRIWDVARSAADIDTYKDKELCSTTGLISHYQFDEGVADGVNTGVTTLPDAFGSNDGTLDAVFALTGTESNWVEGVEIGASPTLMGTDVHVVTESPFTWIDGIEYTEDNTTATFDLIGAGGCDSVVTLNLTFLGDDYSNALNFDGVDDQVNCGNGALDITGTDITVESWVKLDALTGLIWQSTIAAKTIGTGGGYIFKAGGADGQVEFSFGHSGSFDNFTSPAGVITADTWHHVAATYDGAFVRLYVDGAEVFSQDETDAIESAEPNSLYLGNDNTFSPRHFNGSIDEVRIWDVARSAEEIDTYKDQAFCSGTGLVSYYKFDEGLPGVDNPGVTDLPDSFGANDATLSAGFGLSGFESNWVVGVDIADEPTVTGTDIQEACDSFTWIDGIEYTEDNFSATFALVSAIGCDSIVTLNLTINESTTGTDTQEACDSYTWIDGIEYTEDNATAMFTLTNAAGCDSIVTLNLTINESTTGTDTQVACDSYTWIDGVEYTEDNNTAMFTLTNAAGCDSIVTLDLTINTVDAGVTRDELILTADAAGATYQWIDCADGDAPIAGETNQTLTVTENGEYAVIVTEGECSATSECVVIGDVSIGENNAIANLNVYPNPTQEMTVISLGNTNLTEVSILGLDGKVVYSNQFSGNTQYEISTAELNTAVYIMIIKNSDQTSIVKLIKQ